MHAILNALLGRAGLIERVEFHHAPRQVGVGPGLDVEAKAGAADPGNPARLPWGQLDRLAGDQVVAFAEHVAHGSGDALSYFRGRNHSGLFMPRCCSSSVPSAASASSPAGAISGSSSGMSGKL